MGVVQLPGKERIVTGAQHQQIHLLLAVWVFLRSVGNHQSGLTTGADRQEHVLTCGSLGIHSSHLLQKVWGLEGIVLTLSNLCR